MDDEFTSEPDKVIKKWKAKIENKSLDVSDIISYFQKSAPYFLTIFSSSRKDVGSEIGESTVRIIVCGKICIVNKENDFHRWQYVEKFFPKNMYQMKLIADKLIP